MIHCHKWTLTYILYLGLSTVRTVIQTEVPENGLSNNHFYYIRRCLLGFLELVYCLSRLITTNFIRVLAFVPSVDLSQTGVVRRARLKATLE